MMKIFLSLPFSGRTKEEVIQDIENAKELISTKYPDQDLEFIHNYDYEGVNRVECLGEAIKKMATCDKVYLINDWFSHKGCIIEKTVCELYDLHFYTIRV